MMNRLTQRKVLWLLAIVTLLLSLGFMVWTPHVGGEVLDTSFSQEAAQVLLAQMSAEQKASHVWMTLCLDMLYPLAYGLLIAGLLVKYAPTSRYNRSLVGLVGLIIVADLLENSVQIMALLGHLQPLFLKSWLTPVKYGFLSLAILLLCGFVILHFIGKSSARFK